MGGCSAYGCSSRSEKGNIMKAFPRDAERRAVWEAKARRQGWTPNNNSRLCEKHFEADQWEKVREDGSRKLKASAIPTIFCYTSEEKFKYKGKPLKVRFPPIKRRKSKRDFSLEITYRESVENTGVNSQNETDSNIVPATCHSESISPKSQFLLLNRLKARCDVSPDKITHIESVENAGVNSQNDSNSNIVIVPATSHSESTSPKSQFLPLKRLKARCDVSPDKITHTESVENAGVNSQNESNSNIVIVPAISHSENTSPKTQFLSPNRIEAMCEVSLEEITHTELVENAGVSSQNESDSNIIVSSTYHSGSGPTNSVRDAEHINFLEKEVERLRKLCNKQYRQLVGYKKRSAVASLEKFRWKKNFEQATSAIKKFFNEDQIMCLQRKGMHFKEWSNDTIQRALRLKFSCGTTGYKDLLNLGYPLPSLRTLRRRLKGDSNTILIELTSTPEHTLHPDHLYSSLSV